MKKLLLGGLLLAGCPKSPEAPAAPASLVAEAKRALAEREKRLTSYRLEVDTVAGDQRAHHEFAFRSPTQSRGHVTAPQEVEIAFDGTREEFERRFAESQIDAYGRLSGWIFWAYRIADPLSGWNFRGLVERGIIRP